MSYSAGRGSWRPCSTLGVAGVLALAGTAWAQGGATPVPSIAPVAERFIPMTLDSGPVAAPAGLVTDEASVVYSTEVYQPGAAFTRLKFGRVELAGDTTLESGVVLRLTALASGAVQYLKADSAAHWRNTSAYFAGPAVRIEVLARPGAGASRVTVEGVWTDANLEGPQDLCAGADDRVPSTDQRVARTSNGCTAWLFGDTNGMLLTAGHCSPATMSVVSFNVPLSTATGSLMPADPSDQYPVDTSSAQSENNSVGRDWGYFGVRVNSNHGLTPAQRYGSVFTLSAAAPAPAGQTIRITGCGTTSSPISPTWNQAQKTHSGPYSTLSGNVIRYFVDTTGGNSGSPVINLATGQAIGIHTHAGCAGAGNQGTAAQQANFRAALAAPRGVCDTGRGTVGGDLFAIGDAANNFGTLQAAPARFARIAAVGGGWSGLTWHPGQGVFYAINASRDLYTISPAGSFTLLGRIGGTTLTLTGLAFDPGRNQFYAVAPSTGQLFGLSISSELPPAAVAIGPALGGSVRALEYDSTRDTLWTVAVTGSGVQLMRMSAADGSRIPVGSLGIGNIGDLAVNQTTGQLLTVDAASGQLAEIDPTTGAATLRGVTGGLFATAFGVAHRSAPARPVCIADIAGGDQGQPDGTVDGADFIAFVNSFGIGDASVDPAADVAGGGAEADQPDGSIDGTDFIAFINAFAAGC